MTFWDTIQEMLEDQMIEAGVMSGEASARAKRARDVLEKAYATAPVKAVERPRAIGPLLDAHVYKQVLEVGVMATASKKECHRSTVYRAVKRHLNLRKTG